MVATESQVAQLCAMFRARNMSYSAALAWSQARLGLAMPPASLSVLTMREAGNLLVMLEEAARGVTLP